MTSPADGGPTAPARACVVEVARVGAARRRQLHDLSRSTSGTHVEVRWHPASWWDAVLFASALLAGVHCPELAPEDEQACFEQYARALAPTGASWDWARA